MTTADTARDAVRRASMAHAVSPAIARSLARFRARHRSRISLLALRHPRLADLAVTFPGLLFALSVPGREFDPRPAIDLAIAGAPLKKVAAAARIPLWVRRLPPETFEAALDRLPDGEIFRCQIANQLPRSSKLASIWLKAVADIARWGNDDVALWIARELLRNAKGVELDRLRLLALYAWYSGRPDAIGHRFIRRAWHPGMGYSAVVKEAAEWRVSIALNLNLGDKPIDPWLEPHSVMGFDFVPLCSGIQISQEAQAMRNCVREYGNALAHNRQRLWSIRRDGKCMATLSVGPRYRQPILDIVQLRGPANAEAPKEIWVAARRWLAQHDLSAIEPKDIASGRAPLDRTTWIELWRPYWLERRQIPNWLPLAPSRGALERL
jgi:hypothetical protein